MHHIEEEQPDPWWKGPIKFIISLFLLLIIVMWVFSYYGVRLDPEPKTIPTIEEVVPAGIVVNTSSVSTSVDSSLINPNDPTIKYVADRIAAISCDGSKVCQVKAIYYFVRDNFDYVSDPNAFEYVKSAKQSLVSGGGDCDDSAVLISSLLESIGVKTKFVFIPRHVYIQAYLPDAVKRYKVENDWVNLDATCKNCKFGEIPLQNVKKNP